MKRVAVIIILCSVLAGCTKNTKYAPDEHDRKMLEQTKLVCEDAIKRSKEELNVSKMTTFEVLEAVSENRAKIAASVCQEMNALTTLVMSKKQAIYEKRSVLGKLFNRPLSDELRAEFDKMLLVQNIFEDIHLRHMKPKDILSMIEREKFNLEH